MICLIAGGLGLISVFFFKTPELLLLSMVGVGIAWAGILSMPYAILTGALPRDKMGVYMGIFNFFIVIPQILAASVLGFITKEIFKGEAIYSLILDRVGVEPGQAIFVDDNKDNIESAAAMGIHAIRFVNTDQTIREINKLLGK